VNAKFTIIQLLLGIVVGGCAGLFFGLRITKAPIATQDEHGFRVDVKTVTEPEDLRDSTPCDHTWRCDSPNFHTCIQCGEIKVTE